MGEGVDAVKKEGDWLPVVRELFEGVWAGDAGQEVRRGYSIEELFEMESPEALVEDHVPENSLTLLYGPSGDGKSFLGFEMGLSVAADLPFLGKFGVRPGRVMYICSEGKGGVKMRIAAWLKTRNVPRPTLDRFCPVPAAFDLLKDGEIGEVLKIAKRDMKALPDLIIVDTLARNFGGDESATKDMTKFIAGVDRLRMETGAAVVVIHHTGKDLSRKERGNSSLRGACDQVLYVEKVNGKVTKVACEKNKDGEEWAPYKIDKTVVPLPEFGTDRYGKQYSSLVLSYAGADDDGEDRHRTLCRTLLKFLAAGITNREPLLAKCKELGFGRDMVDQAVKALKKVNAVSSGKDGYCITEGGEMLYEMSLTQGSDLPDPSGRKPERGH